MPSEHYRFKTPILGIYTDSEHDKIPITIPQGAVVEALHAEIEANRLVDVIWEGKVVMMFSLDLRNRSEKVPGV